MKLKIFSLIISLILLTPIKAQYFLKIGNSNTPFDRDSVALRVDDKYSDVTWQVSKDSVNWTDLPAQGNILKVWIDSTSVYRALSTSGNCPVISETMVVGMKIKEVDNTFTIGNESWVYTLPSGIQLKVPEGAVETTKSIEFTEYDSIAARNTMPFPADSAKCFVFSGSLTSSETQLHKPVKVRVPTSRLSRGDLPHIYQLDLNTNEWTNIGGYIRYNLVEGYLEFTIPTLNPIRVLSSSGALFFTLQQAQKSSKASDDNCYDIVTINSTTIDMAKIHATTECFHIDEQGSVSFPLCPDKLSDFWHIREIGKNCQPMVEVKIDGRTNKELVKVGDIVTLSLFTYIDDGKRSPLSNQYITIQLPGGLQANPIYGWTNPNGIRTFEVTATAENLDAFINYTVHYDYCLELIEAFGSSEFEDVCSGKHTSTYEGTKRAVIYEACTTPDGIDCSLSEDPECENIKNELPASITLLPKTNVMAYNSTFPLLVLVNDEPFLSSSDLEMNFTSDNLSLATVDDLTGIVTSGDTEGNTTITVDLCGLSDNVAITVQDDEICDNAKVEILQSSISLPAGRQYRIKVDYEASTDGNIYIPKITFTSSNPSCATVSPGGLISAISEGTATVNVSWCDENHSIIITVKTPDEENTFIDSRDGQEYKYVKIGEQTWMAENLNYNGAGFYYEDNPDYGLIYGKHYEWEEALDVCPSGWHLPSLSEFYTLIDYIGGVDIYNNRQFTGGGKLKDYESGLWVEPNTGATNEFGFTALPAGLAWRDSDQWNDERMGTETHFRTSTFEGAGGHYTFVLSYDKSVIWLNGSGSGVGKSVRCIKD